MNSKKFLIFDYGASNGRGLVAQFDGIKFTLDVVTRFENRPVFAAGTLYWDILSLYAELKNGIHAATGKYKDISSLGIDGWGVDFGLIDNKGKLIANPVNYRDRQRAKDSESLYEIIPQKVLFNLTGFSPLRPIFDVHHLYSLKKNGATELKQAHRLLAITDLFNYFLTGIVCNEYSRITTSCLYNQKEGRFEDSIFERIGLPRDIFPRTLRPGDTVGKISEGVCKELQISPMSVIAAVTHDTPSAVAGIPVTDSKANWAFGSMGTWFCFGRETEELIINDETFRNEFSNEGGAEGKNVFVRDSNGLWAIQQCREKWVKDHKHDISWDEIVNLALKTKTFKAVIDIQQPEFLQPQTDMPAVVRDYCRKTGQPVPEEIGEVARCIYESLAFKCREILIQLERISGKPIEILYLVGGGTQNKFLCQAIANTMSMPVLAGPTEATSIGNLLMQLKAEGLINNLDEGRQISRASSQVVEYEPKDKQLWDDAFERYLNISSANCFS